MIISLKTLRESNCLNLYNDFLLAGNLVGATVEVQDYIANEILGKCRENIDIQPIVQISKHPAIPYNEWSLPLKLLSRLNARKEDRGMGDLIERVVGPIGGDVFKAWWRNLTGSDCGCGHRKEWLNERYPFNQS